MGRTEGGSPSLLNETHIPHIYLLFHFSFWKKVDRVFVLLHFCL